MKKVVIFATFLCGSTTLLGQLGTTNVSYTFQIQGISTETSAKNISDDLWHYFDAMPVFYDETDRFSVATRVVLTEEQLREKLNAKGLDLVLFERKESIGNQLNKH